MEGVVLTVIVLAIVAFALGRLHDNSVARKIGREVNRQAPAGDPVTLLEKLHELRTSGALTEAEFQAEKARILNR